MIEAAGTDPLGAFLQQLDRSRHAAGEPIRERGGEACPGESQSANAPESRPNGTVGLGVGLCDDHRPVGPGDLGRHCRDRAPF